MSGYLFHLLGMNRIKITLLRYGLYPNKLPEVNGYAPEYVVVVQPDVNRILRNPLSGWVIYASMSKDASEFWNEYDHMYVPV